MSQPLFPPKSERPRDVEALVGMLASVVADRTAVYVATPITSGRLLLEWYDSRGPGLDLGTSEYRSAHRRCVIEPNLARGADAVRRLRAALRRVVIEPSAVNLEGWQQADYYVLWATIIRRYADTVVFLDGWEYSEGCAYEFFTALETGSARI